ncbi:MAG: uroporphyrinogen decarboxylase family protein [Armatimonadetes bacterium]|nr:uroporphyrinogen decarboxylase family protein [Armatimonadota bacterium]
MSALSSETIGSKDADRSLRALALAAHARGRRPVAPLMGYPGLQLTASTVKQNQFNWDLQRRTLVALYERFQPDAMFFLMDLSVEVSALGLLVRFPLHETPSVEEHPVRSVEDLDAHRHLDVLADGRALVYLKVVEALREELPVPVGAYVTGPFTLAALMMGANDMALNVVMQPDLCHATLELAGSVVARYARALADHGADSIMVLDPTAVMLGPDHYQQFAGIYCRRLIEELRGVEVILHICGDTGHILEAMLHTGAAGLSVDHPMDLAEVARRVGPDTLIMGNVDPVRMLNQSPETVAQDARRALQAAADHPAFILSSGCDVPPDTPQQNIEAFMNEGRNWRR